MLVFAVLAALTGGDQAEPSAPPAPPAAAQPPAAPGGGNEVSGVVITAPLQPPEPAWAKKLNLDPRGTYARSETPYLRRRPTNGCKPMAGGATSPAGRPGAAAGLVCVKPFNLPFR